MTEQCRRFASQYLSANIFIWSHWIILFFDIFSSEIISTSAVFFLSFLLMFLSHWVTGTANLNTFSLKRHRGSMFSHHWHWTIDSISFPTPHSPSAEVLIMKIIFFLPFIAHWKWFVLWIIWSIWSASLLLGSTETVMHFQ